jgi:hypothetical protein
MCAVKGGDFQWVQFAPGDESFQPVAIGAEEEVTSVSKPLSPPLDRKVSVYHSGGHKMTRIKRWTFIITVF